MSSTNEYSPSPVHHLAQLSYAIHLLGGRSVLLLSEETRLAEFIAETGAHVVQVTQADPIISSSAANIDCHRLPLEDLNFEDGVFGAAVIPNLTMFNSPQETLKEVRRILDMGAHLLVAVPNPETDLPSPESTIDYYALYDMLSEVFPSVQMVGQSPFGGYAIADLSCDDPDLEIGFNTDILGDDEESVSWFIALCGKKPAKLDAYTIIQVPATMEAELAAAKLELSNRGVRIESLEKKLEEELMQSEEARARAVKIAKEFDNERKANTKKHLEDEFSRRSQDIDLQRAVADTKKELRLAEERANAAEAARDEIIDRMRADAGELDRLRSRLKKLESDKAASAAPSANEAQKAIRLAEDRARSAEAARDELIGRMRADAVELERLRNKMSRTEARPVESPTQPSTVSLDLTKKLRLAEERARSAEAARDELIDNLREEAAEAERLRQKLDTLESKPQPEAPSTSNNELTKQLRLAEERARSAEAARDELIDRMRADAAELERLRDKLENLPSAPPPPDPNPELVEKLDDAHQKLEATEQERDELAAQIQQDELRLKEKEASLTMLEQRLNSETARAEALKQSIEQLKAETPSSADARQAPPRPDDTSEADDSLKTEVETLQTEIAALEKQLNGVAKDRAEKTIEAERLESLVRDLIVKLEQTTASYPIETSAQSSDTSDTAARISELEDELAALWGAKAGEHRARVEAELELSAMSVELKNTKGSLTSLNMQLKSRDEELKRLTDLPRTAGSTDNSQNEAQQMRIAELEGELQSLKWRIDELNARNLSLTDELDAGIQTADELRAAISEMEESSHESTSANRQSVQRNLERCVYGINALYETNTGLKKRVASQSAQIASQNEEMLRQRHLLEAAVRRERLVDEELDSQTTRANRLKSDLETMTLQLKSKEEELFSAQSQLERMQTESSRIAGELEIARREKREMTVRMDAAKSDVQVANAKIDAINVELKGSHQQISDLKNAIAKGESAVTQQLAETLSSLDLERIGAQKLRDKLTETEARLSEEKSRVEGLNAAVAVLKADLQHENDLMRLAGADAARASGEVAALKEKLVHTEQRVQEQAEEIDIDIRVMADLKTDLESATRRLKALPTVDESLQNANRQEIERLKKEISRLSIAIVQKTTELEEYTAQKAALTETEQAHAKVLNALRTEIDQLEADKTAAEQSTREQIQALERRLEEAQTKAATVEEAKAAEIASLRAQIEEISNAKAQTSAELESLLSETKQQLEAEEATKLAVTTQAEQDMASLQEQLNIMEEKIVDINQSKVDMSAELAETIEKAERLDKEIRSNHETEEALKAEISILKEQLRDARDSINESRRSAEDSEENQTALIEYQHLVEEKESLIGSLTDQLEEREQRSLALEKENRMLSEQIREHEVDVSAWNMELKLRSARISQLEKELQELKLGR